MIFQDSLLMYTISHSECFKKLPIKHKAEGLSGFALQGWPQYFVNFCFRSKSKIAIVEQSFRDILEKNIFRSTFSSTSRLSREKTIGICQFHKNI